MPYECASCITNGLLISKKVSPPHILVANSYSLSVRKSYPVGLVGPSQASQNLSRKNYKTLPPKGNK